MVHLQHQPVLLDEVVDNLAPHPGGRYVDCTLGNGGHALRILTQSAPDGLLLGIDRDPKAIESARENLAMFGQRVQLIQGKFSDLPRLLQTAGWAVVDGMVVDLGVSSLQLDCAERGFSFQLPGPLDMRMDPTQGKTLGEFLDALDADALAEELHRLGDVSRPRIIARRILDHHRQGLLRTTMDLARVAAERRPVGKIHPATRVFLALRMMVNEELQELTELLKRLPDPLKPGGRIVLISFHSQEDRLIKQRLRVLEGKCQCPPDFPECRCGAKIWMRAVHRRSIHASRQEVEQNPRARSANLRVLERLAA